MQTPDRKRAARLLRNQLLVLLVTVLAAGAMGREAAWSAFLGGAIALAANGLFAALLFAAYDAGEPGALATRMYAAEVVKLLFVGLAFAAVFSWIGPPDVAALFVAFFVVQVVTPLLVHALPARE